MNIRFKETVSTTLYAVYDDDDDKSLKMGFHWVGDLFVLISLVLRFFLDDHF